MLHLSYLYVWILDVYRGAPGVEGRQSGLAAGENSRIVPCVLPRYLSLRFSLHAPRLPGQLCSDHQWRPVPLRPRGHAQWDVSVSGREQGGCLWPSAFWDQTPHWGWDSTALTRPWLPSAFFSTHGSERAIGEKPVLLLFFFLPPFYLVLLLKKKKGQWRLLC